jgi:hypothetical protein
MRLYHVTDAVNVESLLLSLAASKKKLKTLTFTNIALPLKGENVFVLTIDDNEAKRYEYNAPLLQMGITYYRIPLDRLKRNVSYSPYSTVTGRSKWDEASVVLKSAHADRAATWSRIWTSRQGAVSVRRADTPYASPDYAVNIKLDTSFSQENDYIILETQQFGGKQWQLELLSGTAPLWADFPNRWNDWVWDSDVQESAVAFLVATFPSLASQVEYASGQTHKVNKIRAWRIVADDVGRALRRDLGKIPAGSWTSVAAMPIRIAQRAGGWTPPKPKPEFEDPNESGRFLLVTPESAVRPMEDFVDERLIRQKERYANAR